MKTDSTYDQHPSDREHGPTVLIVDDDKNARTRMRLVLSQVGSSETMHILEASSLAEATEHLAKNLVHVVLLDKNLGPEPVKDEENGIRAIPEILGAYPQVQVLMVTGSNDIQDVVLATKYGACGYVTKELPDELILAQVKRAVEFASYKLEVTRRVRLKSDEAHELGGTSRIFMDVLRQSDLLAESDRPILLTGETGTGKTALAKRIHARRGKFLKQDKRPFLAINVTTLPKDLIEGELFGHEKGSFTGAHAQKMGLFELAKNGTLFLDEIGELPLNLQPKLLTVIEEGTFMRLGGSTTLFAKPKLIFATNRNLEKMVAEGTFREDLYMRISNFPIHMPSLSERAEDIPGIVRALLPRSCAENRVQVRFDEIPVEFLQHLALSPIQGNIRGIQRQLDQLLVYAPKDESGRPMLERWRSIPGLYLSKRVLKVAMKSSPTTEALSYRELMDRKWDLLDPSFPGLADFLDEVRIRAVHETKHIGSNRDIARALGASESYISSLLKRKPAVQKSDLGKEDEVGA